MRRPEVGTAESELFEAKHTDYFGQPACIANLRPDPEIDVTGEARVAVKRHRMAADDEVLNSVRVQ